jgi:hypothetical protein
MEKLVAFFERQIAIIPQDKPLWITESYPLGNPYLTVDEIFKAYLIAMRSVRPVAALFGQWFGTFQNPDLADYLSDQFRADYRAWSSLLGSI